MANVTPKNTTGSRSTRRAIKTSKIALSSFARNRQGATAISGDRSPAVVWLALGASHARHRSVLGEVFPVELRRQHRVVVDALDGIAGDDEGRLHRHRDDGSKVVVQGTDLAIEEAAFDRVEG